MQLILASNSPRRKELLGLLNIPFTVRTAPVDETIDPRQPIGQEVARLSALKAAAIQPQPEEVVIAADTVVVCDGVALGKPRDEGEAVAMLEMLSGREHQVMTGMTVRWGSKCHTGTTVTQIRFRALSRREIERYVATGEPMDKAGAYGIQGGAALFAEAINGDYYNVVGLPVCSLVQILGQIAPQILEDTQ